jgi:hypothetical protein
MQTARFSSNAAGRLHLCLVCLLPQAAHKPKES